jgi:uncharacterized membrane protein YphA (DoxX/SURF4 family)
MIALALVARLVLGAVFLMSALTKVSAPGRFAEDVRQYRILPKPLSTVFAWSPAHNVEPRSSHGQR